MGCYVSMSVKLGDVKVRIVTPATAARLKPGCEGGGSTGCELLANVC